LDALKEGFRVRAVTDAMRAVELNPGDGQQAIEEMRAAGAEIINSQQGAGAGGR
jgi:nicotinamidase/pyrazinamidase